MRLRFLRLLAVPLIFLGAGTICPALDVTIEEINDAPVAVGDDVYVPASLFPSFGLKWNAGLTTLDSLEVRIDGQMAPCIGQCSGTNGTIAIDQTQLGPGRHSIQVEGHTGVRNANSPTMGFWSTAYKDEPGATDCKKSTVGGPIDVATGWMYYEAIDLVIDGPLPLRFSRRYSSRSDENGALSYGWTHSYGMRIESIGPGRKVFVDADGRRIPFNLTQGLDHVVAWDPNRIEQLELIELAEPGVVEVSDQHKTKYLFDATGKLVELEDRNGNALTFAYTGSNLSSIADDFGRVATLQYDGSNRLDTLTAGSRVFDYTYGDAQGHLTRVDYPDGSFETYEYADPNDVHNLTAVKDSYGRVVESHVYNTQDQVTHTESEGGNYALDLSYVTQTETRVTRTIDGQAQPPTTYYSDVFSGLTTSISGPGCTSCGPDGGNSDIKSLEYDARLNLTRVVKEAVSTQGGLQDVVTEMTYDVWGKLLSRTKAVGTPRQQVTTYEQYSPFNQPGLIRRTTVGGTDCSVANAGSVISIGYDGNGNLESQALQGCKGVGILDYDPGFTHTGFLHVTGFDYDARGRLELADGPRVDVVDTTTYAYYSDTDPDPNRRGRLQSITDALGHVTQFDGYDLFGNVGSIVDQNDVETVYTYDDGDRIKELRVKGEVEAEDIVFLYAYTLDGNLDSVRLPNCAAQGAACPFSLDYVQDEVNRLKEIWDPLGNRIEYTYDSAGRRRKEERINPGAVVRWQTAWMYDEYDRASSVCHPGLPGAPCATFDYYAGGSPYNDIDAQGNIFNRGYDELRRLDVAVHEGPPALVTWFSYDAQNNLVGVTDPNSQDTTYTRSDLGWVYKAVSPDTGTMLADYDPAGNLTWTRDAALVEVFRTYDGIGRLLMVDYPGMNQDVVYNYDSPAVSYGIGRLTGMTDASGITVYHYDRRGLVTREEKTVGSRTFTTQYLYDKTGNLTQVLYPTDNPLWRQGQASFVYNDANRVSSIATSVNGSAASVVSSVQYEPFGPWSQAAFGNGLADQRTYDSQYQLREWTLGGQLDQSFSYNANGTLATRTDNLEIETQTFGYDYANRLTNAAGPWGDGTVCPGGATYTYDNNGNRTCRGESGSATTYSYDIGTNRLASTAGGEVSTYSYDAKGNVTNDGLHSYEYGPNDRLISVDAGQTASYIYDGFGRRVRKTVAGVTTHFFYDPTGRLLSEMVLETGTGADYIYLDGAPIARVDWSVTESALDPVLVMDRQSPDVRADWTAYPSASHEYTVRRKRIDDPADKTFDGSELIAVLSDPTQAYDDPVLEDGQDYNYAIFRKVASETLYYYHTDHLATPTAMTDAGASLVWKAVYRPFGEIDSLPVNLVENNLRFPGQYFDAETGLHQNYFRDYDPKTGRYREPDPLGLWGGDANLYRYAEGMPTVLIDPDGQIAVIALIAGTWAVIEIATTIYDAYDAGKTLRDPCASALEKSLSTGGFAAGIWTPGSWGFLTRRLAKLDNVVDSASGVRRVARKEIPISRARYGEAADHIEDAQRAGRPRTVTIDRPGAPARRAESLSGVDKVPGKQLDEYPPAMFKEGGAGSSVRPINPRDNMAAGACIGNACRGLPDGTEVRIKVVD
ncbi:MAG: hypothetical protein GY722_18195 [bacterium]|nr:hypothetical protein [bacterium]